jgi:hypothetical protein
MKFIKQNIINSSASLVRQFLIFFDEVDDADSILGRTEGRRDNILLQRPGFDPGLGHVGFMVDKVH